MGYIWENLVCMWRSRSLGFHKQVFISILIIYHDNITHSTFASVNDPKSWTIHNHAAVPEVVLI